MARRSKQHSDSSKLLGELQDLLTSFHSRLDEPDLRMKVRALIPAFHKLRDLGSSLLPEGPDSGRERVLAYLRRYAGVVVDGDELMVVSGIGEYPRRIRELRVEFGWLIYTGTTIQEMSDNDPEIVDDLRAQFGVDPLSLRPDQYVLASPEQDRDAAHRWNVANEIRRRPLSVKDKIIAYLRANVGKPITGEELKYLAKDRSEWPRRARELRTEDGWAVATKQSGRPDLPVGVYMLEHERQAQEHDRHIPDDVRVAVLTRDKFSCTECGWNRSQMTPEDPRRFLELHHNIYHRDGGENTLENLTTLCNVDHDKIHRRDKRK